MEIFTQVRPILARLAAAGRLRGTLRILQLLERASAEQALQIEKFAGNILNA